MNYKGDKDPFKGDSLNQRVRDMAKEVISEVLYISPPQQYQSSTMSTMGGTSSGVRVRMDSRSMPFLDQLIIGC